MFADCPAEGLGELMKVLERSHTGVGTGDWCPLTGERVKCRVEHLLAVSHPKAHLRPPPKSTLRTSETPGNRI